MVNHLRSLKELRDRAARAANRRTITRALYRERLSPLFDADLDPASECDRETMKARNAFRNENRSARAATQERKREAAFMNRWGEIDPRLAIELRRTRIDLEARAPNPYARARIAGLEHAARIVGRTAPAMADYAAHRTTLTGGI